nr:hypothetical protein [Tanacetum cinerariifolium]
QKRTPTDDEGRRKYSELAHEPLCSCKDILSSKREWVPKKGYKVNGINQEALKLTKALPTVERQTRSGSFDSGSKETDHKKKRKRWKRKDVSSNVDDSHDSHIEDRKEAKRRRKEEKKLKKEEKHRRREERRHKKDSRRTAKLKLKAGRDVSPFSDLDKSHNSHEEALSDPEKLEIVLREKALGSLRAKKGVGRFTKFGGAVPYRPAEDLGIMEEPILGGLRVAYLLLQAVTMMLLLMNLVPISYEATKSKSSINSTPSVFLSCKAKITNPGQQRSPSPISMSSSPSGRISLSPKRDTPPSTLRRGSSRANRDHHQNLLDMGTENLPPSPPPLPKGRRVPAISPSPYDSPPGSVSPLAARRTPSKKRSPISRKRQRETMNSKDRVDRVELEEKAFSRPRKERRGNKNSVNGKYDNSKYSPEKLTSHLPTGTQAQTRTNTNDDGRRKYSELAHEPLCSRKDILSSKRERVPEKGYKVNGINQEAVKLTKALPTVERQTRSGSFDSGSEETDHKKKRKSSKRKDVTSDDDDSHDSCKDVTKEAKRRRKEERKLKKEEKRRRREERRHKKDSRRTAKLKLKAGRDVSPSSNRDKSHDSHEEALSDSKKLEIKLREKALESLRAKKGVGPERNIKGILRYCLECIMLTAC